MDENAKGRHRAEDVLPSGYDPTRITEPPAIPAEALAVLELTEAHEEVGLTRMLHAAGALNGADVQAMLAGASAKMGLALRLLTGAALALVLAGAALVAGPGAGRAEAMEAPQPDPVAAQTVRVVLGAAPVTVYVRATVYTPVARGWWCGSVFTARDRVGGTCSISPTFPIPVTIDPRVWPAGRTFAQVVDDASDVAVSNVTIDARRPSRFGVGTWIPMPQGQLYVSARLLAYSASKGAWTPQQASPVAVQEFTRHGWRTRATLTTTRSGVASGVVYLGGGPRIVRVARVQGATVLATVGTTRTFVLPAEVLIDTI